MLQGYFSIAKQNFKQSVIAQGEAFYADGFLDVMPFFFLGMAFFKLGYSRVSVAGNFTGFY